MFWLMAAATVAGLLAASSSRTAHSDRSVGRLLLSPLRDGPPLPPRPKHPPKPAEVLVDPPTDTAALVALVVGFLGAGFLATGISFGVFGHSRIETAVVGAVVGGLFGGLAYRAVLKYQDGRYYDACKTAVIAYENELQAWSDECDRIDEVYRSNVSDLEARWFLEQARRSREREAAAREYAAAEAAARQKQEEQAQRRELAAEEREALRRAEEQAAALAALRTARVRTALAWWTTEHPHLEERARCFWTDIIDRAATYRARYDDPTDPCATLERCRELATWALETMPAEVSHFLADGAPSVAELASILRRHHGHEVEELLPLARACQRAELLRPAAEPAAALAAEVSPFADLLADLPAALRSELSKNIHAVIHVDDVRAITAKVVEYRKRQLEADGVAHDVIDERLASLEENLGRATREFARKRGLV